MSDEQGILKQEKPVAQQQGAQVNITNLVLNRNINVSTTLIQEERRNYINLWQMGVFVPGPVQQNSPTPTI